MFQMSVCVRRMWSVSSRVRYLRYGGDGFRRVCPACHVALTYLIPTDMSEYLRSGSRSCDSGSLTVVLIVVDSPFRCYSTYQKQASEHPYCWGGLDPRLPPDPVGLATCHLDSYLNGRLRYIFLPSLSIDRITLPRHVTSSILQ